MEDMAYIATGLGAAVLILGAVLHLLGRQTAISPAMGSRTGAWAQLLAGGAMALFDLSRIPDHHRLVWDALLLLPSLLCLLLSGCLFWRASRRHGTCPPRGTA